MVDRFRSLFTRDRELESRVHTELTHRSRERLASITNLASDWSARAFSELTDEVGYSEINNVSPSRDHIEFILEADTVLVLSYVEHYFRIGWDDATNPNVRRIPYKMAVGQMMSKMEDVLITEGLLWELDVGEDYIQFHPLESEALDDIDKKVRALAAEEPWEDVLDGYNTAFERYLNGDFDELIPKKLYNSI